VNRNALPENGEPGPQITGLTPVIRALKWEPGPVKRPRWRRNAQGTALCLFNSTYYTNRVHHVAHCIFLLLRLGDMGRDVRLDHMTLNHKHERHCIDLIVQSEHSPFAHNVQDVGHVLSGSYGQVHCF
jgi:hypothetical protein